MCPLASFRLALVSQCPRPCAPTDTNIAVRECSHTDTHAHTYVHARDERTLERGIELAVASSCVSFQRHDVSSQLLFRAQPFAIILEINKHAKPAA